MKQFKDKFIIGIDHGYWNIKTANHTFRAGVAAFDSEPVFQTNMLTYGGKYYLVGEGHKEFNADKITDVTEESKTGAEDTGESPASPHSARTRT